MRRAWLLVVAAAALALAFEGARIAWSDAKYRGVLDAGDTPVRDVPGRLEAFEEATRRRPGEFTYSLRSGQLRLVRHVAGDGAAHELADATAHLQHAVEVHPLDPRGRIALARALGLADDSAGMVREVARAVLLGPRHGNVLREATALLTTEWRRTGLPDLLAWALEIEAERAAWSAQGPSRTAGGILAARGDQAQGDVVWAANGRAPLLRAGAALLARHDRVASDSLSRLADEIDSGAGGPDGEGNE